MTLSLARGTSCKFFVAIYLLACILVCSPSGVSVTSNSISSRPSEHEHCSSPAAGVRVCSEYDVVPMPTDTSQLFNINVISTKVKFGHHLSFLSFCLIFSVGLKLSKKEKRERGMLFIRVMNFKSWNSICADIYKKFSCEFLCFHQMYPSSWWESLPVLLVSLSVGITVPPTHN